MQIAQNLADRAAGRPANGAALAEHAKRIEEKADRIAVEARATAQRLNVGATIAGLVNAIEETIDELERAAFTASLITSDIDIETLRSLTDLCAAVVESKEAAASGIDAASEVPEGRRTDSDDALTATTRLGELEHACDAAERSVTALVLRGGCEARTLVAMLELARARARKRSPHRHRPSHPRACDDAPIGVRDHMAIVRLGDKTARPASAEEIGSKAANLDRIARLGAPVPPAFALPVDLCAAIVVGDARAQHDMRNGLAEGVAYLESALRRRFGDRRQPLLVSVRSGAARSMRGMLDIVLNVGASAAAVGGGLTRMTGNPRFAFDCERRFIESYATTVLEVDANAFSARIEEFVRAEGVASERDLDGEALARLVGPYRDILARPTRPFPRIRWSSSSARRAPSTVRGRADEPAPIGRSRSSIICAAPRRWCRPWCSAIEACAPGPASCSRAIRRAERIARSLKCCSARKARTSSPAAARRKRTARSARRCPKSPRS